MGHKSLGNIKRQPRHIPAAPPEPAMRNIEAINNDPNEGAKASEPVAAASTGEKLLPSDAAQSLLESERRSQQVYSLLKIQRDLAVTLSANILLSEAIKQIIATLMSLEAIDGAAVYLVDRATNHLELVAHQGLMETFLDHLRSIPLDSPMGLMLVSGKVNRSNISLHQNNSNSIHAPALGMGLRAGAIFPVMDEGQIIASMNVVSHSLDEFPPLIMNTLEAIAAQAGGAIGRLQAEEASRASEYRYRNLMDLANDAIFLVDAHSGLIVDANQKTQTLIGHSLAELKGLHHTALYPPDLRNYIDQAFQTHMPAGSITFDTILYSSEQQRIHGEISARLIEINGSSLMLAIFHDLSERRQMEAALQASEIRYHSVVESQAELICRWAPDGKITFANQAFRDYFRTLSDDLSMPLVADEDLPQFMQFLAELSPKRPDCTVEARCHFPDGETRWLQWTTQASFLVQPTPVEFQSVGRDITDRVTASHALQASNEQLKNTLSVLETRHNESVLLNKMGDLLQSCQDVQDVYRILVQFAPELFPGMKGALYLIDPALKQAEAVCTWGEGSHSRALFSTDQCWGLRRGRKHLGGVPREKSVSPTRRLVCEHLESLPNSYMCIPLIVFFPESKSGISIDAQRGAFGMFYLESDQDNPEAFSNLAPMVSERIALAVANLRLSEALRSQAIRDPLTDLFNRRYMEEALEREIRRAIRKHRSVGIILVDIDNFKQYNTRFYLDGGDAMLIALGHFLKEHIRLEDIACRYGGDEFVLILPEATLADTVRRAHFIHEEAQNLVVQRRGQTLGNITFSLGVAAYPEHAANVEDLLLAANIAAFQAKTFGGDQMVVSH